MDFGKIEEYDLAAVDFTLPKDTKRTSKILKTSTAKTMEVYVGCAKWGRKEWVGKIYPKGTKDKDFLEAYGKQFNSIEFNAIFYQLPSHQQVRTWLSKVPPGFKFCPKFTNQITHLKRLKNAKHETDVFLDVLSEFGEHLGPVFLMPHPMQGPKHIDVIKDYILSLPKDISLFLELRHPDWYLPENAEAIFSFCEENGVGTVITDAAGRRDCVHMELTSNKAFVRFVGNSLHATDYSRIDAWVQRIKQWQKKGLEQLWFFMHQHDEQYSPELVKYLIDELNTHCKLNLQSPIFVGDDKLGTLF